MNHEPQITHLIAYGLSDTGLVRRKNEDAFDIADLTTGEHRGAPVLVSCPLGPRGALLSVSDGMGGMDAGEIASDLTIRSLRVRLTMAIEANASAALRCAVEAANRDVWAAAERLDKRGMGATLAAVYLDGPTAHIASVGDSRVYVMRGREIAQLTKDQSYVEILVESGAMSREQAMNSQYRHIILQAMGAAPDVDVALGRLELRSGDVLVLCSDGLTNDVSSEEIGRAIDESVSLPAACAQLVGLARTRGGSDNITVVIAEVGGGELPVPRQGETVAETLTCVHRFNLPPGIAA